MGFDPQRFFIGVIDLFSVILPGMIATYALETTWGESLFGRTYTGLSGADAVLAFIIASYLLGHFIFLLGAALLDSRVYGPLRRQWFKSGEVELEAPAPERADSANARSASPTPVRARLEALRRGAVLMLMGEPTFDKAAYDRATKLRDQSLGVIDATGTLNAFQWSKARLLLEQPIALARVERFEADSKFFRSLSVLLTLVAAVSAIRSSWGLTLIAVVLTLLALWRYIDQRDKSIAYAYRYVIMLEAMKPSAGGPPTRP